MGRRLINRDIGSLTRFGARADVIPPQIASLVAQKYQLTVHVTGQAYHKAEYSYKVKSIDCSYGRQTTIPQLHNTAPAQQPPRLTYTRTTAPKGKRKIGEASTSADAVSLPPTDSATQSPLPGESSL